MYNVYYQNWPDQLQTIEDSWMIFNHNQYEDDDIDDYINWLNSLHSPVKFKKVKIENVDKNDL